MSGLPEKPIVKRRNHHENLSPIFIAIAMLFAPPVLAQSPNNAVWGVNDQNEVFRWNPASKQFEQVPGSLKQVSVGTDGAVWGVDPNDNVLRWIGSQWQPVQGTKLKQLSVRNAQEVWGVNAADDLFRWNGSAWEQPIPSKLSHVSVGADGTLWGIGSATGGVYRRDGSAWTLIPALPQPNRSLLRILVINAQRVYGIDNRGDVWEWTGTGWGGTRWGQAANQRDVAEATDGELWLVVETGSIYFTKDQGRSWERMLPFNLSLKQIAVGSASQPPPAGLTAEQQQMLDAHNRERPNYPGVGALQWAPELAQWAQEWADGRAKEGNINHRQDRQNNPFRPGEYVGENIFSSGNTAATGADAVQWWIGEKEWYHHDQDDGMAGYNNQPPGCVIVRDSPACRARQGYCFCGHFTQVIWKNTQYVGCGKATAANGWVYFICNYYPAGNWRGEKPY